MARGERIKHGQEQSAERQRSCDRVISEYQFEKSKQRESLAADRRHQHEQRQRRRENADAAIVAILPGDEGMNADGSVALQRACKERKDGPAQDVDKINAESKANAANERRPE